MKKYLSLLLLCLSVHAAAQHLTIVHTSDTHSCIEPVSKQDINPKQADKAGFVRRATLLQQMRKEHPDMLLFDCGDFSQGSVYYNLFKGEVEVKLMNEMKYDACTIGNHEFDFGLENMARLFRMAKFPIVCSNYDFTGTPCEGLVKDYIIMERAGMRVGVFGICPQLEGLVAKTNYGEAQFLDPITSGQRVVDKLRNEEHCDIVICLSHLGLLEGKYGDAAFIQGTRGIDLVLGGHSHTYLSEPKYMPNADGEKVLLDHQGKNGQYLGVIELEQ